MEYDLTRAKLQERTAEVIFLRSVERELRAERERLSAELECTQEALAKQVAANEALQKQMQESLEALKQSLSWRITAPLRAVLDVAIKFRAK
jgi:hypothetical protein